MAALFRSKVFLTISLLILIGTLRFGPDVWRKSAYYRGMMAAWWDHTRGHYEVQSVGGWTGPGKEYQDLLRERYGVEHTHETHCFKPLHWFAYAQGYSDYSRPRIEAHFGKDVFAECARDASP